MKCSCWLAAGKRLPAECDFSANLAIRRVIGQLPTSNFQLPRSSLSRHPGAWELGIGSWELSPSEFLVQHRPGDRPPQVAVILGRPIRAAIFVALAVAATVDVRQVVRAERLVSEFVNGGPADAAADTVDDLGARGARGCVLDRVVRENLEPDGSESAERPEDVRLASH